MFFTDNSQNYIMYFSLCLLYMGCSPYIINPSEYDIWYIRLILFQINDLQMVFLVLIVRVEFASSFKNQSKHSDFCFIWQDGSSFGLLRQYLQITHQEVNELSISDSSYSNMGGCYLAFVDLYLIYYSMHNKDYLLMMIDVIMHFLNREFYFPTEIGEIKSGLFVLRISVDMILHGKKNFDVYERHALW